MKINSVVADKRKKELVIKAGQRVFHYPFALVSGDSPVAAAWPDPAIGREGIECRLASGEMRTIHLDDIRRQVGDTEYLREQLLYEITLKAQALVRKKGIAKRALCRMLRTSPAQLYRLLDQTCYSKTLDQMVRLLGILGCDVKIAISLAA